MTTRVIVAPRAEADISRILNYLRQNAGPAVAQQYNGHFDSVVERLQTLPASGSPRPQFGPNMGSVVVDPYLIFYEFSPNAVHVLRVLHSKMDVKRRL